MYIESELKERFLRCLRLFLVIGMIVIPTGNGIFGPRGFSLWFLIYIVIVGAVNGLVIWSDNPETMVKRRKKLAIPFFIMEIVILIFLASYLFSSEWRLKNILLLLGMVFILALDGYQALEMLGDFKLRKKGLFLLGSATALTVIGIVCYIFNHQSHWEKQWYFENTGDAGSILEAADYDPSRPFLEGLDVDAKEMRALWDTFFEIKNRFGGERPTVVVAVLDSEIDVEHQNLRNSALEKPEVPGRDGVEPSFGTMNAGIIAGRGTFSGISETDNIIYLPLIIPDIRENCSPEDLEVIISAIESAEKKGAQICNLGFWMEEYSEDLKEVIAQSEMFFVAPAGDGEVSGANLDENPVYPACFDLPNLITVANLSYDGNLNPTSNFGSASVHVAAPGTCIYSTMSGGEYGYGSSSSLSAAIVSAMAAMACSVLDEPDGEDLKNILCAGTLPLEGLKGKVKMGGFVNGHEVMLKAFLENREASNRP